MQNYGESLKYQREAANLTQPELAKKIGTSQANISRWERNEVLPNIDFCVQLATFYGISIDELLCLNNNFGARTAAPMSASTQAGNHTEKEKALLDAFGKMLPETQDFFLKTARSLSDNDAKTKTLK